MITLRRSKARAFSPMSLTQEVGIFCRKNEISLRAGFEPAREDSIEFQVQRLNHSAIAAVRCSAHKRVLLVLIFNLVLIKEVDRSYLS